MPWKWSLVGLLKVLRLKAWSQNRSGPDVHVRTWIQLTSVKISKLWRYILALRHMTLRSEEKLGLKFFGQAS
jgi:hypothetical protein